MSLYDELVKWRRGLPSWKLRFKILGILVAILVVAVPMFPKALEIYQKFNEPKQLSSSQIAQGDDNKQIATTGDNSPVTYIERQENYPPQKDNSLPSADQITALGKRALWSNEYLGSREAYSQLLDWKNSIHDPMTSKLLSAETKRVEDDYRTNIMRLHIDQWRVIWVPHVGGKKGFVKPAGFLAGNVLSHLSPEMRVDERARAACILRNIKTSPDKDSVNKRKFYERLIRHMGKDESSLCVSKMALETYKDLTGFSSDGVFDFDGAVKHWEQNREKILQKEF